jgi:hypothetical protein
MEPVIRQFIQNFEVLDKLMSNFKMLHICLIKLLETKIDCPLRSEGCIQLFEYWFNYFIGVRTEYAFVHYGTILNGRQEKFTKFVHKRTTDDSFNNPLVGSRLNKNYDVVHCSNVGIGWSQGKYKGPVSIFLFFE